MHCLNFYSLKVPKFYGDSVKNKRVGQKKLERGAFCPSPPACLGLNDNMFIAFVPWGIITWTQFNSIPDKTVNNWNFQSREFQIVIYYVFKNDLFTLHKLHISRQNFITGIWNLIFRFLSNLRVTLNIFWIFKNRF